MEPTHIFINGCSFLTYRSKDGIMTHAGKELEKLMRVEIIEDLNKKIILYLKFHEDK